MVAALDMITGINLTIGDNVIQLSPGKVIPDAACVNVLLAIPTKTGADLKCRASTSLVAVDEVAGRWQVTINATGLFSGVTATVFCNT